MESRNFAQFIKDLLTHAPTMFKIYQGTWVPIRRMTADAHVSIKDRDALDLVQWSVIGPMVEAVGGTVERRPGERW